VRRRCSTSKPKAGAGGIRLRGNAALASDDDRRDGRDTLVRFSVGLAWTGFVRRAAPPEPEHECGTNILEVSVMKSKICVGCKGLLGAVAHAGFVRTLARSLLVHPAAKSRTFLEMLRMRCAVLVCTLVKLSRIWPRAVIGLVPNMCSDTCLFMFW
jgi:hypothetical protein